MSAIYASFRDVSGILTPGAAWLVLLVAPLSGVFAAAGAGLLCTWVLARKLHPRLGRARISVESVTKDSDGVFLGEDRLPSMVQERTQRVRLTNKRI